MPSRIDNTEPGLRKRHTSEQQTKLEKENDLLSAEAGAQNTNSVNSFLLSKFIPQPLRQCISGQEHDKTQNMVITPKQEDADGSMPLTKSCSDFSSSSSHSIPNKGLETCDNNDACCKVFTDDPSEASAPLNVSYNTCTTVSSDSDSTNIYSECDFESCDNGVSFLTFRLSYLFVTLVVMLADGLQGKNFTDTVVCGFS